MYQIFAACYSTLSILTLFGQKWYNDLIFFLFSFLSPLSSLYSYLFSLILPQTSSLSILFFFHSLFFSILLFLSLPFRHNPQFFLLTFLLSFWSLSLWFFFYFFFFCNDLIPGSAVGGLRWWLADHWWWVAIVRFSGGWVGWWWVLLCEISEWVHQDLAWELIRLPAHCWDESGFQHDQADDRVDRLGQGGDRAWVGVIDCWGDL